MNAVDDLPRRGLPCVGGGQRLQELLDVARGGLYCAYPNVLTYVRLPLDVM